MTDRIPQNFIDDLLSRVNIVDVIGSRVTLKKAGKNHSTCCPFHNEKTSSFSVSSQKQFYYCFGCGAKGNAITFVMEHDHVDFPSAVKSLAETVGLQVPSVELTPEQLNRQSERASLYDLMAKANDFYQEQLVTNPDKDTPIQYLKNRGLSGKAAKFFNIGFAPDGWDNLKNELGTDKQALNGLIDTGMLVSNDGKKVYDRFRNRVVFPIRDIRGRIVGFGARTLGDDKPKYLNSPETSIFSKSNELYGLYECTKIRQPVKRFVVVEGYMDVVALHEHGIHYAVATLGTATSNTHLQKLFKIAPEIVFCFDGDEAGRKAAKRALEIALPAIEDGQQIRFMFLPEGEDPDTVVRKEGKAGFEQRIEHAQGMSEFLFNTLKSDINNADTIEGRATLANMASALIKQIKGPALKSLILQALAGETRIEEQTLKAMIEGGEVVEPKPNTALAKANPVAAMSEPKEHPLIKQAIILVLHAPSVVQESGSLAFLKAHKGYYGLLLQKLVNQLHQHPQQGILDALNLLAMDSDYMEYKTLAENYNRDQGHLNHRQAAIDCLAQLRLKTANSIKAKLIMESSKVGGIKNLSLSAQQRFQWANTIIDLHLLTSKVNKAGGVMDSLTPSEQAQLQQLSSAII